MDKKLYILAGFDESTNTILDQYKQVIQIAGFESLETKGLPHHITLDSFSLDKKDQLIKQLDTLSKHMYSFDIAFTHLGIFNTTQVLFIAPEINLSLFNLRKHFSSSHWTAHTTMLISDAQSLYQATKTLGECFSPFIGKVTCLYLYEFFPAHLIKRIKLK